MGKPPVSGRVFVKVYYNELIGTGSARTETAMLLEPLPAYAVVLAVAGAVGLFIAAVAWTRRSAPGARPLMAFMISCSLWALIYAIHWLTTDLATRRFWLDATYLGVVFAPVAFLVFACEYTDRPLSGRAIAALCVIPTITLLALFTDDAHGLFYGGRRTAGLIYSGGPAFWLNVVYLYGLSLIAAGRLLHAFRHAPRLQRRQGGLILAGALVPFIINAASLAAGLSPFKDLDLTPLAFLLTGLLCAVGLFRFGMFDLSPVARGVLIERMPDGMLVLDRQQRIIDTNPAAQRLLQRSDVELIGRTLTSIMPHWPDADQPSAPIELALPAGGVAEARLSPLVDRRGRQQGAVILLRDITDRKHAEQALQHLNANLESLVQARTAELHAEIDKSRAILRSAGEALVLTDLDFRIQYVNEAFTTLTGYAALDAIGHVISHQAAWPENAPVRALLQRGEIWQGEAHGRRANGQPYDAALTAAPVRDGRGQPIGCVISYQDITRRKSLERAQSRFIDSISHEFRTPLTNLSLYVELLRAGTRPEKTAAYLDQLADQVRRLRRLIEDSLEMAALDVQALPAVMRPVSLRALAQQVVLQHSAEAAAGDLSLELQPGREVNVWGDADRLGQALNAVVKNALTFTPRGGRVTLTVTLEERAGVPGGRIDVIDTGPGIAPDELPRVFDRFFRGRLAESGHIPGSGLGLSIARAIVRLHGGDLTAASEPGRGSTFSLWLPAQD